jgi:hypothetical protein
MLLRGRYTQVDHLSQKLHFFLAQHVRERPPTGSGAHTVDKLLALTLDADVPTQPEAGLRLVGFLERMCTWLGHPQSRDSLVDHLVEAAMARPRSDPAWTQYLLDAWPRCGRHKCGNLRWAESLVPPENPQQHDAWRCVVGHLIERKLQSPYLVTGAAMRQLLILHRLWDRSGQQWQATPKQLESIEALDALAVDREGESQVALFVTTQRRAGLMDVAAEQATVDKPDDPTIKPKPKL